MACLLVVRLRGTVNVPHWAETTLRHLNLHKRYSATLVADTPSIKGMLKKVKDYVAWSPVDAELIKELYRKGKNLFIVSNNPIVGCLLNLKVAGLGDITGSKYFKRILGANILRGQKHQIELWKRAIAQIGVKPDKIVNIGDNIKEDGEIPKKAGIKKCFVIRRNELEREEDGIIIVKNALSILKYF